MVEDPVDGLRIGGPLVQDGDVSAFSWTSDSARVLHLADALVDGIDELWSSQPAVPDTSVSLSGALVTGGEVTEFAAVP